MLRYAPSILLSMILASAFDTRQDTSQCAALVVDAVGGSNSGILNATSIAAGDFSIDGVNNTVPFCRIFAVEIYGANNSLLYEVWLPDSTVYNGRYVSNGEQK